MNKKSEISTTFTMLLTMFILFIILVFGTIAFTSILKFSKSNSENLFFQQLAKDIEMASHSKGTKTLSYIVPSDVGTVLIVDRDYTKAIITEDFVKSNPHLLDSLQSGELKNIFIFSQTGTLTKSFYIGDVEIAKLAEHECDGYGLINLSGNTLKIKITNRGFGKIVLGDDCTNLLYWAFEYPFKQMKESEGSAKLENNYAKSIRLLRSPTVINNGYHKNGTFTTERMHLNASNYSLYRLYYNYVAPETSHVYIRIGFMNESGDWIFKGKDPEPYYYTNGLAIDDPGFYFNDTKLEITLISTDDQTQTPVLNWVRVAYKDLYRVTEEPPEVFEEG